MRQGATLDDMIAFTIISGMTSMLTNAYDMMRGINASVLDGSISLRLLLPLGFRTHYFLSQVSENLFWSIYNNLPPILVAVVFFGLRFDFTVQRLGLYCVSVALAICLNFCYSFIMGMSVIWLRNSFFLENLSGVFYRLLSGAVVPIWFFPSWLRTASAYLPFRYTMFEPIAILLGKTPMERIPAVLGTQLLWLAILYGFSWLIWSSGRKHMMIQGG
ncbi:MAG: ABC-2 family transporter protein [Clostridiales bacterium]|nr:ABC-2 family transporter protein [Clostridiales bacterium]